MVFFVIFIMIKVEKKMIKLDRDKIQVRYITGISKCLPNYPTPLDVLYESCKESPDEKLFSTAKMENRYEIDEEKIKKITDILLDLEYIEKIKDGYKIVKTPWD